MYRKDYILRLIEQFAAVVHELAGLRRAGNRHEAIQLIGEAYKRLTGLNTDVVHRVSKTNLVNLLSFGGELDAGKCVLAAELLKEEGDIQDELGQDGESFECYEKSFHLFLAVIERYGPDLLSDRLNRIDSVAESLDQYELPADIQHELFHYYRKTFRFAQAENWLFRLLQVEPTNQVLVREGIAFYERLLQLTDSELKLGELPREEVEASLAELKERE